MITLISQDCPDEKVPNFCFEALELLEKASIMECHEEAQNFLRKELELFSEKIVDFLEGYFLLFHTFFISLLYSIYI